MTRTRRRVPTCRFWLRAFSGRVAALRAALDGGVRAGAVPPSPWDDVPVGREARQAARRRAEKEGRP